MSDDHSPNQEDGSVISESLADPPPSQSEAKAPLRVDALDSSASVKRLTLPLPSGPRPRPKSSPRARRKTIEDPQRTPRLNGHENKGPEPVVRQETKVPKKEHELTPREGTGPLGLPIQSLDFDQFNSDVLYKELRRKSVKVIRNEHTVRWLLTFTVGVAVALVALLVSVATHEIYHHKLAYVYQKILDKEYYASYLFSVAVNWGLVLVASLPVIFIEPIAAGGGVAEVKCLLNGMKIPRAVHFKTLCVKVVGTITGVAAGLPIGKEGPMIHAGAIVAAGMSQGKSTTLGFDTSWTKFQPFRNDREKRDFISCGAAAGVAAAFAAPIGGVLYALEEGASFWHQNLTWRSFFCTMVTTTSIAVLFSLTRQQSRDARVAGLFTFGDFNVSNQNDTTYRLYELVFFAVIGALGGILGGVWVRLNTRVNQWRSRNTKHRPLRQLVDVLFMSFLVTSIAFMLSFIFRNECFHLPTNPVTQAKLNYEDGYVQGTCEAEYFNEMFTLFLSPAETAILSLFHSPSDFQISVLFPFFVAYYALACLTAGLMLPAGLFVPTLLIGAAMGRMIGQFMKFVIPLAVVDPGTYALIGAAAFMGGVSRSVVALCVMLVEATGNIQYGLPLMLTLMTAKFVGDIVSPGIYEVQIAARKWAFLEPDAPDAAGALQAFHIMNRKVKTVKEIMRVKDLYQLLVEDWNTNAFPVVALEPSDILQLKSMDVNGKSSQESVGNSVGTEDHTHIRTESQGEVHRPEKEKEKPKPKDSSAQDGGAKTHGSFRGLILRKHLLVILKYKAFLSEAPTPGTRPPLLEWFTFEHRYPRYPELNDIHLSESDKRKWVDLTPYMHRSPITVFWFSPVTQVYNTFRTLGLRHLVVLDALQQVVGMITRKSLTHDFIEQVAHKYNLY